MFWSRISSSASQVQAEMLNRFACYLILSDPNLACFPGRQAQFDPWKLPSWIGASNRGAGGRIFARLCHQIEGVLKAKVEN